MQARTTVARKGSFPRKPLAFGSCENREVSPYLVGNASIRTLGKIQNDIFKITKIGHNVTKFFWKEVASLKFAL
jgi:hypothetical protein